MFEHEINSALIAVGSNQGDREANIELSLKLIGELPNTHVRKKSKNYETAAQEMNGAQPDFINMVVSIDTEFNPLDLLEKLQIIERKLGRMSKGDNTSRPIDLDIIGFGDEIVIQGKNLTIPHKSLQARRFVLEPLAEICPDWVHPKFKRTAKELLEELSGMANAAK